MLYIRTDMNDTIATGHVMRCLSIADAASVLGEQVTFILADNQAVSYITDRGYKSIVLKTKWDDMEAELPTLERVIKENKITSLLVDSYRVTERYFKELSKWAKVMYLDDLNAFQYEVEVIVCYANYWEKFQYPQRYQNVKLYLGTEYMPLRKAFVGIADKEINEKAEKLLLMSGGNDEKHILAGILEAVDITDFENITVICGRYYTGHEELVDKYRDCKNVYIYQAVADIEKYMQKADLAVSAGGTTLYELCACGTPTISFSLADNQLDNVRKFAEDCIIDYAGDVRCDAVIENVANLILKYKDNKKLRQERSVKMQKVVDGQGARRIAEAWIELTEA